MPLNDESRRGHARGGQGASTPRHGRHAAPASSQQSRGRQAGSSHGQAPSHAHAAGNASSAWGSADRRRVAHQGQGDLPIADLANNSDVDSMEQAAPRPVLDPAATGSFRRIDPSEGAVVTNRANAEETAHFSAAEIEAEQRRLQGKARPRVKSREPKVKMSRPLMIGIVVAAAIVIVLAVFLVVRAINSERDNNQDQTVEQTEVSADSSIDYRGTTYSLAQQSDGKYALVSVPDSSESGEEGTQTVYFELDGSPVQLVLYNGAIIIPENLDNNSWDVMAYTIGAGGLPTQVVDTDGNPITGSGKITSAELQGDTLMVTDDSGKKTSVALS